MEFFSDIKDPSFKLELDKVFRGELEAVGLKVRTNDKSGDVLKLNHTVDARRTIEANVMNMYFEKSMIKMKTMFWESNQKGYIYPVFEINFCIRFFPELGIMKYVKSHRRKNSKLGWANCVYSKLLWDRLGCMDTVKRYLKYFDHPYVDDAWKNIIPGFTDYGFLPDDKMKKCWRQPTAKGVLGAAGLPTTKGMIRALNHRVVLAQDDEIPGLEAPCVPQLRATKVMWSLTGNVDMAREVLLNGVRIAEDMDIRTTRKLFIKKSDPKSAVRLGRRLMGLTGVHHVTDSVRLYKGIIKKTGKAPEIKGSIKEIHDRLSYLSGQIRDAVYNKPVKHKSPVKEINGHKFKVGDRNIKFLLPHCPNDLVAWGNILSHCVGGTHYRDAIAAGEQWLIGVVDADADKLLYVVSIRRGDVDQFKGWCNCYPSKAEYNTIIDLFFEFELISKRRFTDMENPSFGSRLEDRAKKLNLHAAETPEVLSPRGDGVQLLIEEYPADVDVFDPGEGFPPLPDDDGNGNIAISRPDMDFEHDHPDADPRNDVPF